MDMLRKILVGLACFAFVLAVVSTFGGRIVGVPAEAYSRACSNLALIAIAITIIFKKY